MGFIAEFTVVTPSMKETTKRVPEMVFKTEDLQLQGDSLPKYVFWASGGDFVEFESAIKDDSTVIDYILLTDLGSRRLYRASLTEESRDRMTYSAAAKNDIVFLDVKMSNSRSRIRAQMPTREALKNYRHACQEMSIEFHLERIYREEENGMISRQGLTKKQYETIILAYEQGYFGDERTATLEELADELGISRQAVGYRLRRGFETLVRHTLLEGENNQPVSR